MTEFYAAQEEALLETVDADWAATCAAIEELHAAHAHMTAGEWEEQFAALEREELQLRRDGMWVRGRKDFMGVLGIERGELAHSTMIAWLLDPIGSHGLAAAPLTWMLDRAAVTPHGEIVDAVVRREAWGHQCIADIVVTGGGWRLVIENKVDAGEGRCQCEILYRAFNDDHTGFLFLTPTGRAPVSCCSEACEEAWRTVGYRDVRALLRTLLAEGATDPGSLIAWDYVRTLEQEFR